MALLAGKRISFIKLLAKQSCSNQAALILSSKHANKTKSILYNNTQQVRLTSTTSKKGNVIAFNDFREFPQELEANKTIDLSFNDSKAAFKSKSNFELIRGYLVFQLCGIKFLLDNQKMLLDISRKMLGKNLFNQLMKNTFYGHFVAGESQSEIRYNVDAMRKCGVKSILDYSAEEDLDASSSNDSVNMNIPDMIDGRTIYNPAEVQSEKNLKIFMDCIDTVEKVTKSEGLAAIKITSLVRPALLLKFSTLVDQIEKYDLDHSDKRIDADLLKISSLLAKSETDFAKTFNEISELGETVQFTDSELGELKNLFIRLNVLGTHAMTKQTGMFVDAEQTYFQGAISRLTNEMMREFNINKCIVMNTYQNYLKSAYESLRHDMEQAKKENYRFGAKLVRGAYMEQERERAEQMGYEDPINKDYAATSKMYETSLLHCLNEIKNNPGFVNIMVASHNEDTVRYAVQKMDEFGIRPNDDAVFFGQLYGMCDFISFYLGGVGYSAYKYVPYGPVEEVLPYLSRRATENGKGVFEKIDKEKRLVRNEIKRRFLHLESV